MRFQIFNLDVWIILLCSSNDVPNYFGMSRLWFDDEALWDEEAHELLTGGVGFRTAEK